MILYISEGNIVLSTPLHLFYSFTYFSNKYLNILHELILTLTLIFYYLYSIKLSLFFFKCALCVKGDKYYDAVLLLLIKVSQIVSTLIK